MDDPPSPDSILNCGWRGSTILVGVGALHDMNSDGSLGGMIGFRYCSQSYDWRHRWNVRSDIQIFVHFDNIPVVTGTEAIIQESFDLRRATPGGPISALILGNAQILWGNVASTYYLVTPTKDSVH